MSSAAEPFARIQVLPSLLSAPFDRLAEAVRPLEKEGCRLLHVDVMDGHFVPNLTMGPLVIQGLLPVCQSQFDVHLMVTNPLEVVPWFELDRVRSITVHAEADAHLHVTLERIRKGGRLAGVSVNPGTSLECLRYLGRDQLDLLLIMTVDPGRGGQAFLEFTRAKIRDAVRIRAELGADFIIQVDGGINERNIGSIVADGAEELVAGNAVFGAPDSVAAYRTLVTEARGRKV